MSIHLNKQQQLEMWFPLACALESVPKEYRSQNHHAYLQEARWNILDLVSELNLNEADWEIKPLYQKQNTDADKL